MQSHDSSTKKTIGRPAGLARAINQHLAPILSDLGFELQYGSKSGWKEGAAFVRYSGRGTALVLVGRDKFDPRLVVNVLRTLSGKKPEPLDVRSVGLSESALTFKDDEELRVVLDRVRRAFEDSIVAWIEGQPEGG